MQDYKCPLCGYTYNPEFGDPDNGIDAGTTVDALPMDWFCPACGIDVDGFTGKKGLSA